MKNTNKILALTLMISMCTHLTAASVYAADTAEPAQVPAAPASCKNFPQDVPMTGDEINTRLAALNSGNDSHVGEENTGGNSSPTVWDRVKDGAIFGIVPFLIFPPLGIAGAIFGAADPSDADNILDGIWHGIKWLWNHTIGGSSSSSNSAEIACLNDLKALHGGTPAVQPAAVTTNVQPAQLQTPVFTPVPAQGQSAETGTSG